MGWVVALCVPPRDRVASSESVSNTYKLQFCSMFVSGRCVTSHLSSTSFFGPPFPPIHTAIVPSSGSRRVVFGLANHGARTLSVLTNAMIVVRALSPGGAGSQGFSGPSTEPRRWCASWKQ